MSPFPPREINHFTIAVPCFPEEPLGQERPRGRFTHCRKKTKSMSSFPQRETHHFTGSVNKSRGCTECFSLWKRFVSPRQSSLEIRYKYIYSARLNEMHFSHAADESPVVILSIRVRMCWAVCRLQVSRKNLRRRV